MTRAFRGGVDSQTVTSVSASDTVQLYDATTKEAQQATVTNLVHPFSGNVAVAADELAIPVTNRHVSKTTGADAEALTLADGAAGQLLTITLVTDGGGDGTLTPTTKTGFATIVFADAGDAATLQFVDSTVGWVIVGLAGVSAPPAITV